MLFALLSTLALLSKTPKFQFKLKASGIIWSICWSIHKLISAIFDFGTKIKYTLYKNNVKKMVDLVEKYIFEVYSVFLKGICPEEANLGFLAGGRKW